MIWRELRGHTAAFLSRSWNVSEIKRIAGWDYFPARVLLESVVVTPLEVVASSAASSHGARTTCRAAAGAPISPCVPPQHGRTVAAPRAER